MDNILLTRLLVATSKTKNTQQKKKYFFDIPVMVKNLSKDIINKTYCPSIFTCFAILDPKPREIFAPHFRDRIIHHFFVNIINNDINKRFIDSSFANRIGKGSHMAVKKIMKALHKPQAKFFLQIDIKSFFRSVDKKILYKIFKKHINTIKITDNKKELCLYLAEKIIFNNPTDPNPIFTGNKEYFEQIPKNKSLFDTQSNKGLPIGSLSSQFFSNLYLNELDQYAKHSLKIKYYFRYVDDIVIIADNKDILNNYKNAIDIFLRKKLKLSLHPNKTILQPTKNGINFLGYIIREDYLLVRKRSVRSFKKKLYFFNHLIDPKNFPFKNIPSNSKIAKKFRNRKFPAEPQLSTLLSILSVINSYYGVFKFADSYKLRKNLYEDHFGELKKFFTPQDDQYKVMKIK